MAEADLSRAGSLHLVGGALCLDFANTASGRRTSAYQEHLRGYDDLLSWSVHGGDLTAGTRHRLARLAGETPHLAYEILQRALDLREAIRGVVLSIARSEAAETAHSEIIAREAAAAVAVSDLAPHAQGMRWSWPEPTNELARPLWPIARSAFELIDTADPARLKFCPAVDCGWIFLDRSKNNSRRWCDMRVCGNRDKVRRFCERSAE